MKNLLLLLLLCFGCMTPPERTVQVEEVIVEIVYMEPYYREGVEKGCKITWRDTYNNVDYLSFSDEFCDFFIVGVRYRALIKR